MCVEGLLCVQLCAGQAAGRGAVQGLMQEVFDAGCMWKARGGKTAGRVTSQRLPDVRGLPLLGVPIPALSFPG